MEAPNYKAEPIEQFHGETIERFHEVARTDDGHREVTYGQKVKTVDGIEFSRLIAEFKVKILNAYTLVPKKISPSLDELQPGITEALSDAITVNVEAAKKVDTCPRCGSLNVAEIWVDEEYAAVFDDCGDCDWESVTREVEYEN